MAISIYSRSLSSGEFGLPDDFDIFKVGPQEIRLISDKVRKRVERARARLPGAVRTELEHYQDLRGTFDLELGDPMGEWNPRRWMPEGGFVVSDPQLKTRGSKQLRRRHEVSDDDEPEFAETMFSASLLMKPNVDTGTKPKRGAILGRKRRTARKKSG